MLHNPPSTLLPSVRSFPACVAKRLGATFKPLQKDENREISNTNQISFLGGLEYIILFSPLDRIPIFANRHLHRLCLVSLKPITETQSLYGKMQTFFLRKKLILHFQRTVAFTLKILDVYIVSSVLAKRQAFFFYFSQ